MTEERFNELLAKRAAYLREIEKAGKTYEMMDKLLKKVIAA